MNTQTRPSTTIPISGSTVTTSPRGAQDTQQARHRTLPIWDSPAGVGPRPTITRSMPKWVTSDASISRQAIGLASANSNAPAGPYSRSARKNTVPISPGGSRSPAAMACPMPTLHAPQDPIPSVANIGATPIQSPPRGTKPTGRYLTLDAQPDGATGSNLRPALGGTASLAAKRKSATTWDTPQGNQSTGHHGSVDAHDSRAAGTDSPAPKKESAPTRFPARVPKLADRQSGVDTHSAYAVGSNAPDPASTLISSRTAKVDTPTRRSSPYGSIHLSAMARGR